MVQIYNEKRHPPNKRAESYRLFIIFSKTTTLTHIYEQKNKVQPNSYTLFYINQLSTGLVGQLSANEFAVQASDVAD